MRARVATRRLQARGGRLGSRDSIAYLRAMPFRRALVIANPISGRGRARDRADALARGIEAAGLECELFFTSARGDATERARKLRGEVPGTDVVVAVGGDGTVAEVLAGLPTSIPLAIHPMGTANVLSRDLAIPATVDGTLAMLQGGRTQTLDIARVNGRLSFLVTGVGFDGAAVRDVEARRRGPIGKGTYVLAVLRTLASWKPPELTVTVDGDTLPGTFGWVLVSNLVGYGGFLRLARERELDDGLYEVFLFEKATRLALVRYALAGMLGRLPGRHARLVRARHVRIESSVPVPYEVDGDFGGETPVELEVTGERYQLILP